MAVSISVVIPAHQEEHYIDRCLSALLDQEFPAAAEIIVVANGCTDRTVERAQSWAATAANRGIDFLVLDLPACGKFGALNGGDAHARGGVRLYLDADVVCGPRLVRQIYDTLAADDARFASGQLRIVPPTSWLTRSYGRIWSRMPFVASDVSGCGLYAVNAAGRRRWGEFPPLHSDDKFVRLQFAAEERFEVAAVYFWPLPEGLANLVRVRRRWCEGSAELDRRYPSLKANSDPRHGQLATLLRLALTMPISATVFAGVFGIGLVLSKWQAAGSPVEWRRGR